MRDSRVEPIKSNKQKVSLRAALALLQFLFTYLLTYQIQFGIVIREQDYLTIGFVLLPIIFLCLPNVLLKTSEAFFVITLANTAALFEVIETTRTLEPWFYFTYVLLMLIASFSPQFLALGSLLCVIYGISVYRVGSLFAEEGLLLPILLGLVLVNNKTIDFGQDTWDQPEEPETEDLPPSMCDAMTGLPNRAEFLTRVWRAVRCAQHNQDFLFAIIFLDLDGFKPINDKLGHKAGDAVLVETAKRLKVCLRKGDTVARYGGDEFTMLINNVSGKLDATRVAERVLRKINEPIVAVRKKVKVGASIGIAMSTNLHERPEDLIRDADLAMYRAKHQGKNQFEISDQVRDIAMRH